MISTQHITACGRKSRNGVTLLELTVVVAILGLLLAIILPAVQQARTTARRVTCQNNLRQFGVAIASHAEAHGSFPTADLPESAYWRLLPFFEQSNLLDEIHRWQSSGGSPPKDWHVASFGCPDDPVVWETMRTGNASYFVNVGTHFRFRKQNGFQKSTREDTRPADVADGLSRTAAMAERLVSHFPVVTEPGRLAKEPRRSFWWTETRYENPGEEPLAAEQCRHHRTTTFPQYAGASALNLGAMPGYDHMLPPNHPACYNGPEDFGINHDVKLVPASSNHPGGVHVLLGDGSVHFASETIDFVAWQALGTRNGHEGTPLPF